MTPKYPDVTVNLVGEDGNARAIVGKVRKALWQADVPNPVIGDFIKEATKGDYDHLLRTVYEWVNVE